jgi:osmotically-inducible protein OsmY
MKTATLKFAILVTSVGLAGGTALAQNPQPQQQKGQQQGQQGQGQQGQGQQGQGQQGQQQGQQKGQQQGQQQQQQAQQQQRQQGAQQGQALANQVNMRLASRSSLAGSQIQATAQGNNVTLTGTVPEQDMKERAVAIAKQTPGVSNVTDQITVRAGAAFAEVDDDQLAKNVAQALAQKFPGARAEEQWLFGWQVIGNNIEVDVEADDGRIMLDGDVQTSQQIIDAIQAARQVSGVRAVEAVDLEIDSDEGAVGIGGAERQQPQQDRNK